VLSAETSEPVQSRLTSRLSRRPSAAEAAVGADVRPVAEHIRAEHHHPAGLDSVASHLD
jgi:hypothetical protein